MICIGLNGGNAVKVDDAHDPPLIDCSALTAGIVAHGLSQVNRFAGQTRFPYSVAEHSVRMFDWCATREPDATDLLAAILLHDAPECLGVGDVQRFVKRKYATDLRRFDEQMNSAVWEHLWVRGRHSLPTWGCVSDKVHWYDVRMGAWECVSFGFPVPADTLPPDGDRPWSPEYWKPLTAKWNWLQRWEYIGGIR